MRCLFDPQEVAVHAIVEADDVSDDTDAVPPEDAAARVAAHHPAHLRAARECV